MSSDTMNQTSWTINMWNKDQTLLDSDLYRKITHKSVSETIKLVL